MIMVFMWSIVCGFLEDLLESSHWQLILSLITLRYSVNVFKSFLMLLYMSFRLCLIPWIDLCSLNGIISDGLFWNVKLCMPSLQHAINSIFYPSLFEDVVSEQEISLFPLPTHFGGLGINNCMESASSAFQSSQSFYFVGQCYHQS